MADWVFAALLGIADAGAVVEELADRSMLTAVGTDVRGQARYRLHDLLRDYAVEQARNDTTVQAAVHRAHDGWLQLASLAAVRLPPAPFFPHWAPSAWPQVLPDQIGRDLTADPVNWFQAERLNLLAITRQACLDGRYQFAIDLALCQAEEQERLDLFQDAEAIWGAILDSAGRTADVKAIAFAQLRLAGALEERGYSVKALSLLEECVPVFELGRDDRALAFALY